MTINSDSAVKIYDKITEIQQQQSQQNVRLTSIEKDHHYEVKAILDRQILLEENFKDLKNEILGLRDDVREQKIKWTRMGAIALTLTSIGALVTWVLGNMHRFFNI